MGRHGVNGAQQRERKALSQEFPLCVNVTMGEAEVCESSVLLLIQEGPKRNGLFTFGLWCCLDSIHLSNSSSGTGQCNKAPLVHMLLPGHFITKEIQAAAVCFVQTTVAATDVETGLVENLKKKRRNWFFCKAGASPWFPWPCTLGGRQSREVVVARWLCPPRPQASEWSDCWDADCACNATSDGSLHS